MDKRRENSERKFGEKISERKFCERPTTSNQQFGEKMSDQQPATSNSMNSDQPPGSRRCATRKRQLNESETLERTPLGLFTRKRQLSENSHNDQSAKRMRIRDDERSVAGTRHRSSSEGREQHQDTVDTGNIQNRKRRKSESDFQNVNNLHDEEGPFVPLRELEGRAALKHLSDFVITPTRKCTSLMKYLQTLRLKLAIRLKKELLQRRGVKAFLTIRLSYVKASDANKVFEAFLHTKIQRIVHVDVVSLAVQRFEDEVLERNANYMRHESGLIIDCVHESRLSVGTYNPIGATFAALPPFLANKKAIINVKNDDNRCFGYALLSCLMDGKMGNDASNARRYGNHFREYKLDALHYPVEIADLLEIERSLNISMNVYSFFDDTGAARYPVYVSQHKGEREIDLLYWNEHYAWIKSFERFMSDITKSKRRKFFCKRCLCHFTLQAVLDLHTSMCTGDTCQPVITMPPPGTTLAFQNVRFMQRQPFVVYADFECLTTPIGDADSAGRRTKAYQAHVPCSVGLTVVNTGTMRTRFDYETYTGADVCTKFLNRLVEIEEFCVAEIFDDRRLIMTEQDRQDFEKANECYVCGHPFRDPNAPVNPRNTFNAKKVRDHDHMTGKYRGAAHQTCNLRLRKTYKIPVIFHNFRGYDSHLLIAAFGLHKDRALRVIGQGMEKYLTIDWGDHIVFKDSLQFLGASLESLAACLLKSGRISFEQLRQGFPHLPDDKFELLLRKGVYPYDYMGAWEKLQEEQLPPIEAFASKLRGSTCDEEDYAHAQHVWQAFECKKMQDYHDLYLKTDVLLLADAFESFRDGTLENYQLDPSHYVSSPHLSWDAMLKMTKCELQLLDDPEMFRMLDSNLRGGISTITKRYARANNPRLGALYDPSKPTSHIMYWDANNLYGWAMSQLLPVGDFRWLSQEEFSHITWCEVPEDGETGYVVECDLDYPDRLHDSHNEYPLAAEKVSITVEMIGEKQLEIHRCYSFNRSSTQTKLIPNLLPKTKYCCHYRNLQFYLTHGMRLRQVHRVLAFKQSTWLKKYIETNQDLRAASTDEYKKKLYKDMNNSCFGKTCENQKHRSDIRLITDADKCKKLLGKPHCKGFQIFTDEIAAINMSKLKTLINRPFYVGFSVLELSKLHMLKFHYDVIKRLYPGKKSELLFTDTDSLMYLIHSDDVFNTVWRRRDLFDLSGYPKDFFHDPSNNKVIGKFKDEANAEPILEFVGLRPKMYSYVTVKDASANPPAVQDKLRAKGIQRAAAKLLRHQDFLNQLRNPQENYLANRRIGSKLHKIFTYTAKKRGLCAFDDKRYIEEDGVNTLAYGHFRITKNARTTVLPDTRTVQSFRESIVQNQFERAENSRANLLWQKKFPEGLDPKNAAMEARKRKLEVVQEPITDFDDLVDLIF